MRRWSWVATLWAACIPPAGAPGDERAESALSTPEVRLRDAGLDAGEGTQTRPIIAAGDGGWLVVWRDARAERPRQGDLYAARVSFDGGQLDPIGFPISAASSEISNFGDLNWAAAWNGDGWDVAWLEQDVDVNGVGPRLLRTTVSPGGAVAAPRQVTSGQGVTGVRLAASPGGPVLMYRDAAGLFGSFAGQAPFLLTAMSPLNVHRVTWDGQEFLVTFTSGAELLGMYFDADGGSLAIADGGSLWTIVSNVMTASTSAGLVPDAGLLLVHTTGFNPQSLVAVRIPSMGVTQALAGGPTLVLPDAGGVTNLTDVDVAGLADRWLVSWRRQSIAVAKTVLPNGGRTADVVNGGSVPELPRVAGLPGPPALVMTRVNFEPYRVTLDALNPATLASVGHWRLAETRVEAAPNVGCGTGKCMVGFSEQFAKLLAYPTFSALDPQSGTPFGPSASYAYNAKSLRPRFAPFDGGFVVTNTLQTGSGLICDLELVDDTLTQTGGSFGNAFATHELATLDAGVVRFGPVTTTIGYEFAQSGRRATSPWPSYGPVAVAGRGKEGLGVFHNIDGGQLMSIVLAADGGFGAVSTVTGALGFLDLGRPAAASDGQRYLVAWDEGVDGGRAVLGRFVEADGSVSSAAFAISAVNGWNRSPAATFVSGLYLVGWETSADVFSPTDLRYTTVSPSGTVADDPGGTFIANGPEYEHDLRLATATPTSAVATYVRVDEAPLGGAEPLLRMVPVTPPPPVDAGSGGGAGGGGAGAGGGAAGGGSAAGGGGAGGGSAEGGGGAGGGSAEGGGAAGGGSAEGGGAAGGGAAQGGGTAASGGGAASSGGGTSSSGGGGGSTGGGGEQMTTPGCGCASSDASLVPLMLLCALLLRPRARVTAIIAKRPTRPAPRAR